MPERKPIKPSQFTESFQFIQSLFQEEESKQTKALRFLQRSLQVLKWLIAVAVFMALAFIIGLYQIEAITLTDQGIWIPRR